MSPSVDLLAALSVLILLVVLGLWWYVARHSNRVDHIDRRVSVLEERVSGMPAVKAQLNALQADVAAIRERSQSTAEMVRSIQQHLMESNQP